MIRLTAAFSALPKSCSRFEEAAGRAEYPLLLYIAIQRGVFGQGDGKKIEFCPLRQKLA